MDRDAGGMDLDETWIAKKGPFLVGLPCCAHIGSHGHGGKEKGISVATGCKHHCMGGIFPDFPIDQIAGDDPPGPAFYHDKINHFLTGNQFDFACLHLAADSRIGSEQKLLACLSPGIESP